jgi:hypothetical protein
MGRAILEVDVHVDEVDARLHLAVSQSGVPGPGPYASVANVGQGEAAPGGRSEVVLPANWNVSAFSESDMRKTLTSESVLCVGSKRVRP